MDKQSVMELFARGQDCGQVVLSHYAEKYGLPESEANRLASCFGGGSGIGETCGAVIGALAAIGLRYGHCGPDDMEQRNEMMIRRAAFIEAWKAKRGSCMCRELLGYDVSKPDELQIILDKGLMMDLCPELVLDAVEILDSMGV